MKDYANKKSLLAEVSKPPVARRVSTKAPVKSASSAIPKAKPARKNSPSSRRWLRWVILAVLVVVVINGVVHGYRQGTLQTFIADKKVALQKWLHHEKSQRSDSTTTPTSSSTNTTPDASKAPATPAATPPPAPQFDFYTVLPSRTVGTGDGAADQNADSSAASANAASSTRQFVLQVASYQNQQDAEKMRAQLLLIGLSPTIDKSDTGWYRVDLGPFTSVRDADVVRHKIQKANINGAMVRQVSQ